ncbi:MAG: universal stress protein [Raineya sp.]|jgi:nucleotide-binding universal stress UspA family protein|nr:universal stress protein [Raineya sp.]
MKKILVPTDFSDFADKALQTAVSIAKKIKAEIFLVNVNEMSVAALPIAEYYYYDKEKEQSYLQMVNESLDKTLKKITSDMDLADIPVSTLVESGLLVDTVEEVSRREKVDLIIMGTQGATGTKEMLIGSNTEKVVRNAPCPVLSVPNKVYDTFKKIVFPTTLRPDQLSAFKQLADLQTVFEGQIQLLYLNNPAHLSDNEAIIARKDELVKESGLKNVDIFMGEQNVFDEENAILDFAKSQQADLIVMATHQRKGLAHLFLGSITEDTINHAEVPVLAIPIKK